MQWKKHHSVRVASTGRAEDGQLRQRLVLVEIMAWRSSLEVYVTICQYHELSAVGVLTEVETVPIEVRGQRVIRSTGEAQRTA